MLKTPIRWLALLTLLPSAQAAHIPARKSTKETAHAEVIGFWRFERDVKPEAHGIAGPAKRVDGAEFFFSDEVPGPYIYDPLQRLSYPNSASLNFQSGDGRNDALEIALNTAKASLAGPSVTLELFFKPDAEWDGPLAMKARTNDSAAEWGLEARYFEQQKQTYLHGFFTPPGGETIHFRGGHYGSSVQIRSDNNAWRHMAFIYDAEAKTLTTCIDYYQSKTVPVPGEMKWDAGSFYIGGGPHGSHFGGRIDEVRLTKGALRPSQFLRARADPIASVSFESVETVLPRDSGYIDLKESFGAVGDGRTDDTAALKEAFRVLSNQAPLAHYTLYIPPGTYLVSDALQSGHSLDIQGAGSDKTIIKLRDKCPGFVRKTDPHAVWQVGNRDDSVVDPSLASISIYNLTVDTGKGNAGAKGLGFQGSHLCRLEDLQVRSADGAGVAGFEIIPPFNSPALLKDFHIKGFQLPGPLGILSRPQPENPPDVPWGDIHKDWVNVQKFAGKKAGEDWAPAIQAAVDSGARTVYFPPERYEVLSPVHVHGKVERLFGLHSHIVRGSGVAPEEPAVIFDEPDAKRVLSIERLEIDGLRHASPATLVLKDTNPGRCESAGDCGKLFAQDSAAPKSPAAPPQSAQ